MYRQYTDHWNPLPRALSHNSQTEKIMMIDSGYMQYCAILDILNLHLVWSFSLRFVSSKPLTPKRRKSVLFQAKFLAKHFVAEFVLLGSCRAEISHCMHTKQPTDVQQEAHSMTNNEAPFFTTSLKLEKVNSNFENV